MRNSSADPPRIGHSNGARSARTIAGHAFAFGPFRLDPATESIWRDGEEIRLRPKTFTLLRYVVERPRRLITKDELLGAVWGDVAVGEAALAVCVGEIRKALGDEARTPRFIETVHGRGYRARPPGARAAR